MSAREYRPPREMDAEMRRGTRGEPSGRPIPSDIELREAADRHERERHAHHDEPSIWTRFTHSLAGKVLHR